MTWFGKRTFSLASAVILTAYASFGCGSDSSDNGDNGADGRAFLNIDDYKQLLLSDKDQLARNLAEKLIIYSTGADIQFADRQEIERLVADSKANGYGFRSILHAVVESRLFLYK